ncbi:glycosyltransferase family 4 protein [Brevibacillus sp. H7]|uniref:glycosyltransferase family 4 protein n=1 Tax=Brevibacillus sp. H7 TaxID=3349138 RepID=UPI0038037797
MRILLAGYISIPNIGVGGISTYVFTLQRELQRLGHEVDILFQNPPRKQYYMLNNGRYVSKETIRKLIRAKLRAMYTKRRWKIPPAIRFWEVERYSYEMAAAYFGLDKYDLIHAQDVISAQAIWRVKPKHIPLVLTVHGDFLPVKGKYFSMLESRGAVSSNLTIAPSQWMKNRLVNMYHVPANHITVIPYGLDITNFLARTGKPVTKSAGDKKIILCVARLAPVKGHRYLLDALAKLKRVRRDWECWMAGDGTLRRTLVRKSKRLHLQHHVRFLGKRRDVPQLLNRADIFAFSSVQECRPFAIIEAQIAGKPIVSTNAGGIPEIVQHGASGLLSPIRNSEAMYRNLKRALEDEALRASMAENGQKRALENWSVENMLNQTLAVYERVMKRRIINLPVYTETCENQLIWTRPT